MNRKGVNGSVLALVAVVAVIAAFSFGLIKIPNQTFSLGDTSGSLGSPCSSGIHDNSLTFSCSAYSAGDCDWAGSWDFNGIANNVGDVTMSQAQCAAWQQTWNSEMTRCHFDNLNALIPYMTGSVQASKGTGNANPVCSYNPPLGFTCTNAQTGCYGGGHQVYLQATWNMPPVPVQVPPSPPATKPNICITGPTTKLQYSDAFDNVLNSYPTDISKMTLCAGGCNATSGNCAATLSAPAPPAHGFSAIFADIWAWITGLFGNLFSVTGETQAIQGKVYVYRFNLTAQVPNHNPTGGTYQTQYSYWALLDNSQNIIQGDTQGTEINGTFVKDVSITIPKTGKYVLVAAISEIDSTYDTNAKIWLNGKEAIVNKEALDITSGVTYTTPSPGPGGFFGFIQAIIGWLKGLLKF